MQKKMLYLTTFIRLIKHDLMYQVRDKQFGESEFFFLEQTRIKYSKIETSRLKWFFSRISNLVSFITSNILLMWNNFEKSCRIFNGTKPFQVLSSIWHPEDKNAVTNNIEVWFTRTLIPSGNRRFFWSLN